MYITVPITKNIPANATTDKKASMISPKLFIISSSFLIRNHYRSVYNPVVTVPPRKSGSDRFRFSAFVSFANVPDIKSILKIYGDLVL